MLVLALLLTAWSARADAQSITGTVTDAGTGAPLNGVSVRVYNTVNSQVASVTTNASGVYTASVPGAGTYYLRTLNSLGYIDEVVQQQPMSE